MEVKFESKDKVLVVAPHPDDEAIGCGGLLAMYGKQCDVLVLTDGRHYNDDVDSDGKEFIDVRANETKEAMKLANVNEIIFLGIEDSKLADNKVIVMSFDITKYDYIFVPNRNEAQLDHKIVLSLFNKMRKKQKRSIQIYEYEVWTALRNPTWILDISSVIDIKKEMISKYVSQLEKKNYYDACIGLNAYRGLAYNFKYGEAYTHYRYSDLLGNIYQKMPESIKNLAVKIVSK